MLSIRNFRSYMLYQKLSKPKLFLEVRFRIHSLHTGPHSFIVNRFWGFLSHLSYLIVARDQILTIFKSDKLSPNWMIFSSCDVDMGWEFRRHMEFKRRFLMWNYKENSQEKDHDRDGKSRLGNMLFRTKEEHGRKLRTRSFGKTEVDGSAWFWMTP